MSDCYVDKEASVAELLNPNASGEGRNWKIKFHNEVHNWELDSKTSLFTHIYSLVPNEKGGDRMRRSLNGNGTFDVRSFYKAIRCAGGIPFPWKSIKRVSFFYNFM